MKKQKTAYKDIGLPERIKTLVNILLQGLALADLGYLTFALQVIP